METPEVIGEFVNAVNAQDLEKIPSYWAEDIVFNVAGDQPFGGVFVGASAFIEGMNEALGTLDFDMSEVHTEIDGDKAAVIWRATARSEDGETATWTRSCVYTVSDDKIVNAEIQDLNVENFIDLANRSQDL
jgi:ketosteroid isomerase-like protein